MLSGLALVVVSQVWAGVPAAVEIADLRASIPVVAGLKLGKAIPKSKLEAALAEARLAGELGGAHVGYSHVALLGLVGGDADEVRLWCSRDDDQYVPKGAMVRLRTTGDDWVAQLEDWGWTVGPAPSGVALGGGGIWAPDVKVLQDDAGRPEVWVQVGEWDDGFWSWRSTESLRTGFVDKLDRGDLRGALTVLRTLARAGSPDAALLSDALAMRVDRYLGDEVAAARVRFDAHALAPLRLLEIVDLAELGATWARPDGGADPRVVEALAAMGADFGLVPGEGRVGLMDLAAAARRKLVAGADAESGALDEAAWAEADVEGRLALYDSARRAMDGAGLAQREQLGRQLGERVPELVRQLQTWENEAAREGKMAQALAASVARSQLTQGIVDEGARKRAEAFGASIGELRASDVGALAAALEQTPAGAWGAAFSVVKADGIQPSEVELVDADASVEAGTATHRYRVVSEIDNPRYDQELARQARLRDELEQAQAHLQKLRDNAVTTERTVGGVFTEYSMSPQGYGSNGHQWRVTTYVPSQTVQRLNAAVVDEIPVWKKRVEALAAEVAGLTEPPRRIMSSRPFSASVPVERQRWTGTARRRVRFVQPFGEVEVVQELDLTRMGALRRNTADASIGLEAVDEHLDDAGAARLAARLMDRELLAPLAEAVAQAHSDDPREAAWARGLLGGDLPAPVAVQPFVSANAVASRGGVVLVAARARAGVDALAVSARGDTVAAWSRDGAVEVFDARTGASLYTASGSAAPGFSADGAVLRLAGTPPRDVEARSGDPASEGAFDAAEAPGPFAGLDVVALEEGGLTVNRGGRSVYRTDDPRAVGSANGAVVVSASGRDALTIAHLGALRPFSGGRVVTGRVAGPARGGGYTVDRGAEDGLRVGDVITVYSLWMGERFSVDVVDVTGTTATVQVRGQRDQVQAGDLWTL
ncbi:MAG: hypothetical protein H6737_06120 [Alphaproteobacteria bacterium]|nr:hypothetical protein [Alphaproteobacteria bacterium]